MELGSGAGPATAGKPFGQGGGRVKATGGSTEGETNPQKLGNQIERALEPLKTHKYLNYWVDAQGQIRWAVRAEVVGQEARLDGLYVLGTNTTAEQVPNAGVVRHYKNLLKVEDGFCHLESHMNVRPVFHVRPGRVRNDERTCFLAYWLSAKLAVQWRQSDQRIEVHNLVRQLQAIWPEQLVVTDKPLKVLVIDVPGELNVVLNKLGLLPLFTSPPSWGLL